MEPNKSIVAELTEKIALLEEIQNINQIGHWELCIESNKLSWSDMVYDIHEVPRNTEINKTQGINFYHSDYQEIVSKAAENCIIHAEPFNIECKLITQKKSEKWVRATGRKVGDKLIGSFQDITAIKEQELKFKGIFNSTFTFIGFLDTNGILLEANDTAVNMAGIKRSDVIGKHFWDCYWWQISKQAQEELKANFQKAISGHEVEYEVSVWIADKRPVTILFTLKPIFDDNGKVIYVIPEGRPVQELADSRRRYKSVLEGTNVGTWEWNVQTGETMFNERWADIVGYTLEELAPISIETRMNLAHPDDLEESGKRLTACFEKKSEFYEFEARMKHKDGHWVWVHDRGKVMVWTDDGKPLWMYGTHQDISKRKKAEEESKRTSILLEAAQRMAKMGAWELDLATGKTFWTDEVYHIHEVTKDFDHNKVNGIEFYHPDYRPIITKAITESIEKQIPFNVKCKFITAKNNLRWVRSSGYPLIKEGKVAYLIGMFRDITEEEEAKEAIIREQSFSKQLLENMADGFSVVDFEGKQIGVNKAFCEMTGFSEEELIGQTAPYPYWPEEELENIGKAFQQTLAGELSSFELTFKRKNDNRFPVLLSASALLDENGNPISYFANIKDITERNKAEQELKATKQKLDSIFSEMDDVVWSVSLPDYKMLFMTPSAVKLYGIPYEEFLDDSSLWEKAIYQDDKPIIQNIYQQLQENGNYEHIYRIASRDGKIKWVSNKGKIIHNEQDTPIRIDGVLSDISERKKAEQELVKTKDMLLRTGEVAKVGGWEFNNLTGEITWSDTNCDIHEVPQGFTPTYEQMASFYTPESWVQLEKAIQDATTNGVSYDLELKIITAKGKEIWVRAIGYSEFKNGKCVRLFGVLQDISIQKKAELMIVQSREQYQSLVQNIPGITYRCKNDKNWTMLYMSSQVDSITGYTAEEFMGSNSTISYGTLIHPEDQQMVTKAVNNGIAANMPWAVEYRVRHKDDSIRWAFEKGTAIKNEDNEVLYLDGFILDITDRKKAENEINSLLSITEEQNDRLKNFAYIVSHNLRSHSGGISGLLDLFLLTHPDFAKNEFIELLKSSSENLKQTIEDLTEIVRVNFVSEEFQMICISKIVEKIRSTLSSQIKKSGMKIMNEIPETIQIKGITAYMESIVLNFITNTIKYKSEEREPFLKIYHEEDASSISLFFKDNGLGIDLKKHGDKLFGMYKTFHQHDDSRGVGLFITKNQVESMGGKISVESEVNVGTNFKIVFKK